MSAIKKARHRTESPQALLDSDPFQGDLDAELEAAPKRSRRPGPTALLVAGVIAVAGFIGGVQAHKTWGAQESASPGGSPPAALGGGQSGQSRQGQGGSFGGMTSGTVTGVKDGVISVKTSDGRTVRVKTSDGTQITVTEKGTAKDLKSGTSVVVQGETAEDGTVNASTVTEGGGTGGFGGTRPQSGN